MENKKEKKVMCEDCKKKEAKLRFSNEPMFALTHGFGIREICRACYIKRMEAKMKDLEVGIKEQKRLMKNGD